jgi:SAM-dependent methyltransferase
MAMPRRRPPDLDLLACPNCKRGLSLAGSRLVCSACGCEAQIENGIPCFAPSDPFYDAYSEVHAPFVPIPRGLKGALLRFLPYWSYREWRFWEAAVPACERLLDIGCGRGHELFARRARQTAGFDVSLRFISECTERYELVAQGDLPRLPFASSAFDVVVSSHVLGHVPADKKDETIAEIRRTLRPGGITAHLVETDSAHRLVRAAKERPEAYRAQFVEQDGHVGLEPASRVIARFRAHGFELVSQRLVDALVPSRQSFNKYLDHPAFAGIPGIGRLRAVYRLTSWSLLNVAYEMGMGLLHRTAEQWWADPDKAQFVMLVLRRR